MDRALPRSTPSTILQMLVVAAAISAYWALFPYFTTDVGNDYVPWFNHIVHAGPIAAFGKPFGAYTPPYLYVLALATPLKGLVSDTAIIKIVAMSGIAMLAGSVWHLMRGMAVPHAERIAIAALALPSVILNAALLGQCDAMYAAPLVMAVAAALSRRHHAMLAWSGFALAIKAQAVALAPFVLAVLLARRVPIRQWPIAAITFLAALVPAWLVGWPAGDLLTIYFRQADTFHQVSLNAPNIWLIMDFLGIPTAPLTGLAMAMAVGACAAYAAHASATMRYMSNALLLRAALLAPLLVAGLMPRMHERYFFVADILSLALATVARDRESIRIAFLVQFGSFAAVMAYVSGITALAAIGGTAMIAATLIVVRPFINAAANDNPVMMPTTS